jgi:hypothetical protein
MVFNGVVPCARWSVVILDPFPPTCLPYRLLARLMTDFRDPAVVMQDLSVYFLLFGSWL